MLQWNFSMFELWKANTHFWHSSTEKFSIIIAFYIVNEKDLSEMKSKLKPKKFSWTILLKQFNSFSSFSHKIQYNWLNKVAYLCIFVIVEYKETSGITITFAGPDPTLQIWFCQIFLQISILYKSYNVQHQELTHSSTVLRLISKPVSTWNETLGWNRLKKEKEKHAFYFILKALSVLKIFKFLSWFFSHVEKMAWLEL